MNKPTIPADVADTIEMLRKNGFTNKIITKIAMGMTFAVHYREILSSIPFDTLLAALVNGYEREMTEEERRHINVREAYERWEGSDFASGISFTLNALGIVIDGINEEVA